MLLENTGGANPPEQREAAAHALCAGLLAQGCAQGLGNIDPELAFACAALRQFGAILLPVVSLKLCREMLLRKKSVPEDQAARECFGLTPLELSRRLLRRSKLPEEVQHSLRPCAPETMDRAAASSYQARLLGVAAFGGQLAALALNGSHSRDVFTERSCTLARDFAGLLPGIGDLVEAALVHTDDRIGSFSHGQNTAAFCTPGLQHIKSRVLHKSPDGSRLITAPPVPVASELVPVPEKRPTSRPAAEIARPTPVAAAAPVLPGAEAWTESLARSAAFATQPAAPAPVADPWVPTLTFVCDSFGAQVAWMFAADPRGDQFGLAHGVGPAWAELRARAMVRPAERTVFGVCLARRENVVIHDRTEPTLAAYLPAWFRDHPSAPGAFILMPLLTARRATGLVLIGWSQPQQITVTPAQTEIARQLFASRLAA
jgi:hypothetical protein